MIHVVAKLTVDPDRREEFLAVFAELTPKVLAEQGCLEYGAAIDEPTGIGVQEQAGEDAVMVIEKWASVPALEAHLAAPHMDDFREATASMLRGLSLHVLKPATDAEPAG
ncbi:MAG: putative quinol monooxygenase [Planctomycetota bacterium]